MPLAAGSADATTTGACLDGTITNAADRITAHDLTNDGGDQERYWAGWWLEDCANLAALASGDAGGRFGEAADGTAWPEGGGVTPAFRSALPNMQGDGGGFWHDEAAVYETDATPVCYATVAAVAMSGCTGSGEALDDTFGGQEYALVWETTGDHEPRSNGHYYQCVSAAGCSGADIPGSDGSDNSAAKTSADLATTGWKLTRYQAWVRSDEEKAADALECTPYVAWDRLYSNGDAVCGDDGRVYVCLDASLCPWLDPYWDDWDRAWGDAWSVQAGKFATPTEWTAPVPVAAVPWEEVYEGWVAASIGTMLLSEGVVYECVREAATSLDCSGLRDLSYKRNVDAAWTGEDSGSVLVISTTDLTATDAAGEAAGFDVSWDAATLGLPL